MPSVSVTASALVAAAVKGDDIAGIGFDATCSLVALDGDDRPLSVSPSGNETQNIIVWMDHRAAIETEIINSGNDEVLRYVGGRISIEMQMPKLLWLKRHLPQNWQRAGRFFDLPDYLTVRATGQRCAIALQPSLQMDLSGARKPRPRRLVEPLFRSRRSARNC